MFSNEPSLLQLFIIFILVIIILILTIVYSGSIARVEHENIDIKKKLSKDLEPYLTNKNVDQYVNKLYINNNILFDIVYTNSYLKNLFRKMLQYNKCVYNNIISTNELIKSQKECNNSPLLNANKLEIYIMNNVFNAIKNN